MPFRPSKKLMFLSGNGSSPSTQCKFEIFHIEFHFHNVMSIFKLALGAIALVYWLKSLDEKKLD